MRNCAYGRKWRGTKGPLDEGERGEWKSWLKTQHSKNKDHGIQSHRFRQIDGETMDTVAEFIILGSKITVGDNWSHEIKRHLLLGVHDLSHSQLPVLFCWLHRASPSLAAKNIINLISVLTLWWCPCVESSLVLLEEGVCYDQCVLLEKLLAFALLHSVLQGQICPLLQVSCDFLLLHSSPLQWKGHLFLGVSSRRSCRSSENLSTSASSVLLVGA